MPKNNKVNNNTAASNASNQNFNAEFAQENTTTAAANKSTKKENSTIH